MKTIIEIVDQLKARRTQIASNQDMAAIGELSEINATLKTLEKYNCETSFMLESQDRKIAGKIKDLGSAFSIEEGRYVYEFKISNKIRCFTLNFDLSITEVDIVINAIQNARKEMNHE